MQRSQRGRFGRPEKPLPDNFDQICGLWRSGELTSREAAKMCGMACSTFYRKGKRGKRGNRGPGKGAEVFQIVYILDIGCICAIIRILA